MSRTLRQVEEDPPPPLHRAPVGDAWGLAPPLINNADPPPLMDSSDLGDPADFEDLDDELYNEAMINAAIDEDLLHEEFCPTMVMSSVRLREFACDLKVAPGTFSQTGI